MSDTNNQLANLDAVDISTAIRVIEAAVPSLDDNAAGVLNAASKDKDMLIAWSARRSLIDLLRVELFRRDNNRGGGDGLRLVRHEGERARDMETV